MPNLPLRPCTQSGCPALTKTGRCPQHARPVRPALARPRLYDELRGNCVERGYDHTWKKKRDAWLKLHLYCVVCGRQATVVDHRIPKSIGGRDDESNYQSLCTVHHNQKTGRERRRGIM